MGPNSGVRRGLNNLHPEAAEIVGAMRLARGSASATTPMAEDTVDHPPPPTHEPLWCWSTAHEQRPACRTHHRTALTATRTAPPHGAMAAVNNSNGNKRLRHFVVHAYPKVAGSARPKRRQIGVPRTSKRLNSATLRPRRLADCLNRRSLLSTNLSAQKTQCRRAPLTLCCPLDGDRRPRWTRIFQTLPRP